MSQNVIPTFMVGNDLAALPRHYIKVDDDQPLAPKVLTPPISAVDNLTEPVNLTDINQASKSKWQLTKTFIFSHIIVISAIMVLGVGFIASRILLSFETDSLATSIASKAILADNLIHKKSLTITVPTVSLNSTLRSITSQLVHLTVGNQTVSVSPSTIKNWLVVLPDGANKADSNVLVSTSIMMKSLNQLANSYTQSPVDQVSVIHNDGITPSGVIVAGHNGTALANPNGLMNQVKLSAPMLTSGKGLSFNAPIVTAPFKDESPANFAKLIEVDLTTKRLYAYQNGQLINNFLVSAGKPSTPTPVGEFHIWTKLTSQTMIGPGYVQPNVPWVNYFDYSGDAIHGVYWRPISAFGNVNTSHGCVGLEIPNAEWLYNWAPIGTTVITHT